MCIVALEWSNNSQVFKICIHFQLCYLFLGDQTWDLSNAKATRSEIWPMPWRPYLRSGWRFRQSFIFVNYRAGTWPDDIDMLKMDHLASTALSDLGTFNTTKKGRHRATCWHRAVCILGSILRNYGTCTRYRVDLARATCECAVASI